MNKQTDNLVKTVEEARTVVITPIYKEALSETEERVLHYSLSRLSTHDVYFIAPYRLDIAFYRDRFDGVRFLFFHNAYFESPQTYSRLLLNTAFYQRFLTYTHMLIVQTDAVVLRDDLAEWVNGPFDFVGAPWHTPLSITMPTLAEVDSGFSGSTFLIAVGNGGFSLRRIRACINVLEECGWLLKYFALDEDLFFALASQISSNFIIPNTVCAARFSLESTPGRFYAMTGHPPMGGHAWERWDKEFWINLFRQHDLLGVS